MSAGWGLGAVLKTFICGYLIGGLTLIPALLTVAWFWGTTLVDTVGDVDKIGAADGHGTNPHPSKDKHDESSGVGVGLDDEILEKLKGKTHVPDVCAGYFAVCREYVPGGVNGKPPDRTTPAGAVISVESPSVYQSMYRSIFDRNKATNPTIDASNNRNKKARNVFFVVLRLGHLMLYDNDDQIEVRHVISLAHYKVDIHAGGECIPEGELWIKRNCIRLVQVLDGESLSEAKSFFLFSENCSEKEDFYHAMLQAQEHHKGHLTAEQVPIPLKFETTDLVKLVQHLHASEENLHTRWINALIGRVFLAMYKTTQIKDFIAAKINKKIARVPKPALVSSITLRKVDMGTLPPFVTNPKLKELTVDGDLIVEADVSYKGNFRIEISAIVRIDLGARFKAREVTLVLATVLKKLDGHMLLRIKPPPSNRLWMTFETPPKIDLSLEPIVSSRQITYGPILRVMENRIREVVNETLVLPNWDDTPFTDTIAQAIRGGIWNEETDVKDDKLQNTKQEKDIALENAIADAAKLEETADSTNSHNSIHSSIDLEDIGAGVSLSTDKRSPSVRPLPLRSGSSAAQVNLVSANASAELFHDHSTLTPTSLRSLPITSPIKSTFQSETTNRLAESSDSSAEDVSTASISGASARSAAMSSLDSKHNRTASKELSDQEIAAAAAAAAGASNLAKKPTLGQNLGSATAAARQWLASKQSPQSTRTGPNNHAYEKYSRPISSGGLNLDGESPHDSRPSLSSQPSTYTEPMGRGQPLPPPGTPLPHPKGEKRQTWSIPPVAATAASTFANLAKRKPLSNSPALGNNRTLDNFDASTSLSSVVQHIEPQDLPHATQDSEDLFRRRSIANTTSHEVPDMRRRKSSAASSGSANAQSQQPPPLPKRRPRQPSVHQISHGRRASQHVGVEGEQGERLLIVEAPVVEAMREEESVTSGSFG